MRLRPSQPTWTHSWPEPISRMQNDKTNSGDRYCSHDHPARIGGVMAISYCSHLRSDFACACGNSSSNRQERIKTQLRDTSALDFALRGQYRHLWPVDFSCRQVIDQ